MKHMRNCLLKIISMTLTLSLLFASPANAEIFSVGAIRGSENFDEQVRENCPWFFKDGEFHSQGINQYGYTGTCGEAALASALNHIFSTSYYTENMILKTAVDYRFCTTEDPVKENLGGMSPENMMRVIALTNNTAAEEILKYPVTTTHIAETVFDSGLFPKSAYVCNNSVTLDEDEVTGVDADLMLVNAVPDVEKMAEDIDNGYTYLECVCCCILWGYDRSIVEAVGMQYVSSNHWIVVSNTIRDSKGELLGFYIIDSGKGEKLVDKNKMHEMIFGLPGEEVPDEACIRIRPIYGD